MQESFNNQGMPAQVDKSKFQVGKNLGTSPGAVIFRNPVLELIQYKPTTGSILSRLTKNISWPTKRESGRSGPACEHGVDFASRAGVEDLYLQTHGAGRRFDVS